MAETKTRCEWCCTDPLYLDYHDQEWGVPVYDDHTLFEFLILEGAQAGLNWLTILKKRHTYREAFDDYQLEKIANYSAKDIARLKSDPGIIRNQLKIEAAIKNAKGTLQIIENHGSLSDYFWSFVDGSPIVNHWNSLNEVPTQTAESETMSKALKKRGFNFVGPTICYAFMQAVGMVNDHTTNCFRHSQLT